MQDLQDLSPNILAESEIIEKTESELENQNQDKQEKAEVKKVTPSSPASPANPMQDIGLSPASSPDKVLQTPLKVLQAPKVNFAVRSWLTR